MENKTVGRFNIRISLNFLHKKYLHKNFKVYYVSGVRNIIYNKFVRNIITQKQKNECT
jgi:hypothetical protein